MNQNILRFYGVDPADLRRGDHSICRIEDTEGWSRAADFVDQYHGYIDWADRPSRKMYWSLWEKDKYVGVFGLGSAFARPKDVMNFMEEHDVEFNELGNNIVFCMYGHEDRNAGSRFLSLIRRDAKKWWQERYEDELKAIQTFILPPRTGSVYKADNWKLVGETSGGKTITSRTLYGKDRKRYEDEVEVRTFKNGETKWILREWVETEKKLIFMKLL